ncbi:hypothetical protein [Pseudomonas hormoni]
MQVFFSNKDPVAEAQLLVNALTEWLAEQPEQPAKRGKAFFKYGPEGLRTVNVVLADEGGE